MNIDVLIEAIKGTQGPLRYHQETPADQLQREYPSIQELGEKIKWKW